MGLRSVVLLLSSPQCSPLICVIAELVLFYALSAQAFFFHSQFSEAGGDFGGLSLLTGHAACTREGFSVLPYFFFLSSAQNCTQAASKFTSNTAEALTPTDVV